TGPEPARLPRRRSAPRRDVPRLQPRVRAGPLRRARLLLHPDLPARHAAAAPRRRLPADAPPLRVADAPARGAGGPSPAGDHPGPGHAGARVRGPAPPSPDRRGPPRPLGRRAPRPTVAGRLAPDAPRQRVALPVARRRVLQRAEAGEPARGGRA